MNAPRKINPHTLVSAAAGAAAAVFAVLFVLSLTACNGPWNMQPETGPQPAKLWVSMLLVADRPMDTLWIERPTSLYNGRGRDSSAVFVDSSASDITVAESPAGTRIRFLPVPGRAAAWVPEDTAYRVKRGMEYVLAATVRWNASGDFPSGSDIRTETLAAKARVPASYSLDSTVQVPVEALHPSLSTGLPEAVAARARADAAYRKSVYDSLSALPGARSLADRQVTEADFAEYLDGKAVFRPLHREDTLYYIFDAAKTTDYTGSPTHRYSLPWLFRERIDKADFGGVILSEHFDSTRARIYDPIQKGFDDAFQSDLDSVQFYQHGSVRPMITAGSYFSDIKGYPDTLRLTNLLWGYTGRNVLYAYSVDPLYYEYYKGLIQSGTESGSGLGGSSSRPQNILRYSNVKNGDGYFSAAIVDSFAVNIRAVRDTIPVSALRDAWIRDQGP
ncbi:MAG: hypothetical protein JWO30_2772 [Fibrobacteres bacterium]|nr:hypothetical protein [Fibrobacterota bacterium]